MAQCEIPDKQDVYINEGWEQDGILPKGEMREFLVVTHHKDSGDYVMVDYQDINGVGNSDVMKLEDILTQIEAEGYTLYKTVEKNFFEPKLEFFKEADTICYNCKSVINVQYYPKLKRFICHGCLVE